MPYSDLEKQRAFQRDWKRRAKDWFRELKAGLSCARCGFSHPAAIQFHHTGSKEADITQMVQRQVPRERILAEIAKCEVLCANCHFIEHFNEGYRGGRPRTRQIIAGWSSGRSSPGP